MAKIPRNYRISEEVDVLIKAEAERLSGETGKKVSEADVIEMAIVRWCTVGVAEGSSLDEGEKSEIPIENRRAVAEEAMQKAALGVQGPTPTQKPSKWAETVAQRKAREAQEHAAKLAESDHVARAVGREDIEYDLDNVVHRSALPIVRTTSGAPERVHCGVQGGKVKPLAQPHGSTMPKPKRQQ